MPLKNKTQVAGSEVVVPCDSALELNDEGLSPDSVHGARSSEFAGNSQGANSQSAARMSSSSSSPSGGLEAKKDDAANTVSTLPSTAAPSTNLCTSATAASSLGGSGRWDPSASANVCGAGSQEGVASSGSGSGAGGAGEPGEKSAGVSGLVKSGLTAMVGAPEKDGEEGSAEVGARAHPSSGPLLGPDDGSLLTHLGVAATMDFWLIDFGLAVDAREWRGFSHKTGTFSRFGTSSFGNWDHLLTGSAISNPVSEFFSGLSLIFCAGVVVVVFFCACNFNCFFTTPSIRHVCDASGEEAVDQPRAAAYRSPGRQVEDARHRRRLQILAAGQLETVPLRLEIPRAKYSFFTWLQLAFTQSTQFVDTD